MSNIEHTDEIGESGGEVVLRDVDRDERLVVGTFQHSADARVAIESLRQAGFEDGQLGVLVRDDGGELERMALEEVNGTCAGKGAAVGAAAGAGGGALWAAGIAAGVLPAIGQVVAGGLLIAVATGLAAGAAAGSVVGTLVGLGIPDDEAMYYDEEFRSGKTIVVVTVAGRRAEAYRILRRHQAKNRYASHFLELPDDVAPAGD